MKTLLISLLLPSVLFISLTSLAKAPTQFVVTPKGNFKSAKVRALPGITLVKKLKTFGVPGIRQRFIVRVQPDQKDALRGQLAKLPFVEKVEDDLNVASPLFVRKSGTGPKDINGYQWALHNSGQTLIRQLDIIQNLYIKGRQNVDIGWYQAIKEFEDNLKETPSVAVPDFGVSWRHPDLLGQMLYNPIECQQKVSKRTQEVTLCTGANCRLQRPTREQKKDRLPPEDRDSNGLAGDCLGWNFSEEKNPWKSMDPRETSVTSGSDVFASGHGTHIAGVMAAKAQPPLEVHGVSQKIKVLPLKIFFTSEDNSTQISNSSVSILQDERYQSLTSYIAEALAYSASRGVKVVNASFGVPEAAVTDYFREAFTAVINQGVTIVAASGNNEHNTPIYPCAFKGVICVGAISVDGEATNFTNYGGHVDIYAPGEQILSLFPPEGIPPLWPSRNYELMSGTSQAAPLVSAMVALMRARWPEIKNQDVLGLLHQASSKTHTDADKSGKYFNGDLPRLPDLKASFDRPILKPQLKELGLIPLNPENLSFAFPLEVRNLGKTSSKVNILVSADSKNLTSKTHTLTTASLGKNDTISKSLIFSLSDFSADSTARVKISITYGGATKDYFHEFQLARDLNKDTRFERYPIADAEVGRRLVSINDIYENAAYPEFYSFERTQDLGILKVFRLVNGQFKQVLNSSVADQKAISLFRKLDLNYDGSDDYFIQSVIIRLKEGCTVTDEDNCREGFFVYSYLNSNFEPLFDGSDHIEFRPQDAVLSNSSIETLRFLPKMFEGKKIAWPMFRDFGSVPEPDLNPDTFEDNPDDLYHYFLVPSRDANRKLSMRERIIQRYDFKQKLRSMIEDKLGRRLYDIYDTIEYTQDLIQTEQDFALGRTEMILRAGEQALAENFVLRINDLDGSFELLKANYTYENYSTDILNFKVSMSANTTDLSFSKPKSAGTSIVGFLDVDEVRLSFLDSKSTTNLNDGFTYKHTIPRDDLIVQQYLHSYKKGSKYHSFFGSKQNLIAVTLDTETQQTQVSMRPLVRSDFISGFASTQLLYPMVAGSNDGLQPALFVDDTALNSRRSFLWLLREGQLVAPARYSLFIPENCFPRNPNRWGEAGEYALLAMCTTEKGLELLALPIR